MKAPKLPPINEQIYSEASFWLVEFRSGDIDAAGRKAFYEWLRTSPEHIRAYLELSAIWNEGHALASNRSFEDAALDLPSNVVPLADSFTDRIANSMERGGADLRSRSRGIRALARVRVLAAASLLLAAMGALTGHWYNNRSVYTTGIGEQHRVRLADGSVVQLNAESKIRVRYHSGRRDVDLLAGQALFRVAHDAARPFVVHTASSRVKAVGTQFDVYRKATGTTVTVIEGVVALLPTAAEQMDADNSLPDAASHEDGYASSASGAERSSPQRRSVFASMAPGEVLLSAGEQAIVTPRYTAKRVVRDVEDATAWTRGHLVFRGALLQDVAIEFNRYNTRRIVIRGDGLESFKVSGRFSSTDPDSLIRFLEGRPEVHVSEMADEIVVTANRSAH